VCAGPERTLCVFAQTAKVAGRNVFPLWRPKNWVPHPGEDIEWNGAMCSGRSEDAGGFMNYGTNFPGM
jgi:hypothetical protein